MFRNRLYYGLKPLMPASMRLAIRRWFALRKRGQVYSTWPILPGSERLPANWPGWPDGKQFAFVLTHDVEGPAGLAKCRQLMELEMKLGFRSSFNFIPEGDYTVPPELIRDLKANGFEVGVHDLHHDGSLYRSRRDFSNHSKKINQYLKDWGAAGFRSGSMFHNLDWLHDLEVSYDASTFDTDPFEPQPDGVNTIFPFFVPSPQNHNHNHNRNLNPTPTFIRNPAPNSQNNSPFAIPHSRGYIELPYTLPQDSTLFLLLQERHPDIWFQKLDWIAKHGGMALINVHPDYLSFEQERSSTTYPVNHYEDLLAYLKERYAGRYWQPNPTEVASRCRENQAAIGIASNGSERNGHSNNSLKGKRAAVVLYSYYATDPRPKREAEALIKAGMEVDVICLRRDPKLPMRATVDGANVLRIPLKRRRSSKLTYTLQYAWFFLASFAVLSWRSLWKRYHLVHVHNMPDFLVFAALGPRIRGAKVILDLHDPMPELFRGIYGLAEQSFAVKVLKRVEKLSIRFANLILTPNVTFRNLFVSRSCPNGKIRIVTNSPQITTFDANKYPAKKSSAPTGHFKIMYHGLLVERHGLDLAIQALAKLRSTIPHFEFHIYGEQTDYIDDVMRSVRELNLEANVKYHGFKSLDEIAEAVSSTDLGLIPNRLNPFTQINLPTRIFEYLAMGKPVIVPRTQGIQDYFRPDQISFFRPGDAADLAAKIEYAYNHPHELAEFVARGTQVYEKHLWPQEEKRLTDLVEGLLAKPSKSSGPVVRARRIAMITYSNYESDNRVMRYAEELVSRGDTVEIFALRRDISQPRVEVLNQVQVNRVQTRTGKKEQTRAAYLLPLLRFWASVSARLTWRHLKHRYDLVHVHNVPDFLVFAAWYPKLTGAGVILDIHDIVPEFYGSKFKVSENSTTISMLKRMERASAQFADRVIISNDLWLEKYATRTGANGKCSVFINNVDPRNFQPRSVPRKHDKPLILFPGGLQWHQGLDIAIRAFKIVAPQLPTAEFHIYGDGNMKENLKALTRELGLEQKVLFFEPLPVRQIAEIMANADLGVVPKRADSFGNEAYSTKIMEFMSLGVPVVASSTKIDRFYFNDSIVRFFESGNVEDLAKAMVEVLTNVELSRKLVTNAFAYAEANNWESRKADYLALVDSLIPGSENGGQRTEAGGLKTERVPCESDQELVDHSSDR